MIPTDKPTPFAWTPGQDNFDRGHNYVHYPQYFNVAPVKDGSQVDGLRVVVRGPETYDGQHYAMGETVAIVLPPDVVADFLTAMRSVAREPVADELLRWLKAVAETCEAPGVDREAFAELVGKGALGWLDRLQAKTPDRE